MPSRPATRTLTLAAALLLLAAQAAPAQTDYFWQAPAGGSGNWDTSTQNWSTTAAGPVNYTWTNNSLERANFGNTAGTVTLTTSNTVFGLNFSVAGYTIGAPGNVLILTGTGGPITGSSATIAATLGSTVGITKTGASTLTLTAANTYTGTTRVSGGGTVAGTAQASGSPFGVATNPVSLDFGNLRLNGIAASTTTTVGTFTVVGANAAGTGSANLTIDNTTGGAGVTTALAAGDLTRLGSGAVLVITPVTGGLGTTERVSFTNGNASLTNGILPAWVVATASGTSSAADFVTHGAGGVAVATYSSADLTTSTNTSVVNQATAPTITAPVAAYALKTNQAINLNGNTLTLGNGTGTAGLILNGGSITGGPVSFGAAEGVVHASGTASIGGNVSGNGLTVTALGAAALTLGGTIADGPQPSGLVLTGQTSGTSFTLSGANTYTGGTTMSVNTGSTGNVFIGSDTAFGTGKVTNILSVGGGSPQLQALGGARTLANAFDLNGGLAFTGTNALTFTGPITVINAAAGGTRTLNTTVSGLTVTLGSAASPSTITLGNPVANGGDGVGKGLQLTAAAGSTIVVNDVMQDPAAGGGAASGSVIPGGGGTVRFNGLSTYTGITNLSAGTATTIQIGTSSNAPFTAGPFGVGTLTPNNGTNSPLQPVDADRVVANPVNMITGFTANNAAGQSFNLTLSGPITLNSTQGRTINNSMAAGASLILGSATAPSTFTLNTAVGTGASVVLTLATNSSTIVINDVIQDPTPAPATPDTITVTGGGTMSFNALNTYAGGTSFTGAGTIVPINLSSNGLPGPSFTAGPFGTGPFTVNNGTNQHFRPIGGDKSISNQLVMTTGFAMDNAPGTAFNLTLAGPVTMQTTDRFLTNGFSSATPGGTLILGSSAAPSTITLGSTATGRQLSFAALSGPIVVNDVIQDPAGATTPGSVRVNPNAGNNFTVTFNAANTYAGGTSVLLGRLLVNNTTGSGTGTGAVTVTGTGAVGSGGTLGGSGSISGAVTISSTTATSQGGTLSPGNSIGTLRTGEAMTWNPLGSYLFEHNPNPATFTGPGGAPAAGTDNDTINLSATPAGTLSLANLSSTSPFNVVLVPVGTPPASPPTTPVTYVAGSFTGVTLPAGFSNPGDVTPLFNFTGFFVPGSATAAVNGGVLTFSFTPVPEPAHVLFACGLAAGGLGWWRRRRA